MSQPTQKELKKFRDNNRLIARGLSIPATDITLYTKGIKEGWDELTDNFPQWFLERDDVDQADLENFRSEDLEGPYVVVDDDGDPFSVENLSELLHTHPWRIAYIHGPQGYVRIGLRPELPKGLMRKPMDLVIPEWFRQVPGWAHILGDVLADNDLAHVQMTLTRPLVAHFPGADDDRHELLGFTDLEGLLEQVTDYEEAPAWVYDTKVGQWQTLDFIPER